ncbi:hypothetical protein A2303_02840 [Candidatus Falkowbacteria bacterium RIFOXYB2_FULL_47_14]|uniref:Magnesium transport protein CorA n=1 Tax=Candidatus Falkowbacteria bacterium RIFOXYA2_FULL_47_19 TaxID=1797994 RepID=A0A1F5SLN0_9BACT|nr:MAG: hypothetical protein A2227_01915 [Candidatus Falkowbacteria bacterium RIFOXYA2_FULL_47_19]OGF36253.1 MAG: hypothetical protein A2468_07585 [Candidatus Falkowbacteria bacterium RIFOXYC2_FULL_46_15]OGF43057.1 MAG: hypothetical protein A2303_02840 [Candidatus Falkowbacteria bacterium RIFOXYB2_FULL_47_14]
MLKTDNINEIAVADNDGHKISWINIRNAGKTELDWLRKKFDFKLSHLSASSVKAVTQRSIIEKTENYIFMILHFPVLAGDKVVTEEIDFFVGKDYLVTSHDNKIGALNELFSFYKKENAPEDGGVIGLLCHILEKLSDIPFALLDKNGSAINELEDMIFDHKSRMAASRVLSLRLGIINACEALQNHQRIIDVLTEYAAEFLSGGKARELTRKIHRDAKTIWLNLENQREIVEVLNSTNESFMNYQISNIMKTLTIFSVIVFPLTLLAAIFGMNTVNGMPFMETKNGFWAIIGIMLCGSLFMVFYFKGKKWL